jgi:DNA-binding GntR family transcriptional regulator
MTTIAIDAYILDTLMRDLVGHDRRPSAFLVYLYLWRATHGRGGAEAQVALLDIAEDIGLSKRSVQEALSWLSTRELITVARQSITAVPVYTVRRPWRR